LSKIDSLHAAAATIVKTLTEGKRISRGNPMLGEPEASVEETT
jgi:hypothetical protein